MDTRQRFLRTLNRYAMVHPGERVVVAVSGGPDSSALLHLFLENRDRLRIKLSVAHLNHGLRGAESDADAAFVRALARRHRLPLHSARLAPGRLAGRGSVEARGREERLRFFRTVLRRAGADRVAVGHQENDQAETFLLRLVRGSGRTGLGGIHPVWEGYLIRPLIEIPRTAILEYLRSRGIPFRDDASNRDRRFLRNRIREDLIPALAALNPGIVRILARTADRLREEDRVLESLIGPAARAAAAPNGMPTGILGALPAGIRPRAVLAALAARAGGRRGLTGRHVDAVLDLIGAGAGKRIALPGGLEARRVHDRVRIVAAEPPRSARPFHRLLQVPGDCTLPGGTGRIRCRILPPGRAGRDLGAGGPGRAFLDADRVRFPLVVRNRRPGDRFRPLGAPGRRKIQDFFVDRKIPAEQRGDWPLVTSGGEIVWVVGCRIDDRYRLRPSTRRVLLLERSPRGDDSPAPRRFPLKRIRRTGILIESASPASGGRGGGSGRSGAEVGA
ncbi:MAG: tRNA lysidine(34) synthetase TilS [Acidobacteria bacterium]|nr:tRNA lysidine(34) synthetase TilS [Acidobacteriota bacterium]